MLIEILTIVVLLGLLGFLVYANNKNERDVFDKYRETDNKAIDLYTTEIAEKEVKEEPKQEEPVVKPKRARNKKGQLVADDKSTPEVNEAWKDGVAPVKEAAKEKKPRKPKLKVSK